MKHKIFSLPCECRCCSVVVEDYNDGEIGIRFESSYLNKKNGRLKRAHRALCDKETYYAECVQSKETVVKFLKAILNELDEKKKTNFNHKIELSDTRNKPLKFFEEK